MFFGEFVYLHSAVLGWPWIPGYGWRWAHWGPLTRAAGASLARDAASTAAFELPIVHTYIHTYMQCCTRAAEASRLISQEAGTALAHIEIVLHPRCCLRGRGGWPATIGRMRRIRPSPRRRHTRGATEPARCGRGQYSLACDGGCLSWDGIQSEIWLGEADCDNCAACVHKPATHAAQSHFIYNPRRARLPRP